MVIDGLRWRLSCGKMVEVADRLGLDWEPGFGIRCDDLAATARRRGERPLLFVVESKGTARAEGLSPDAEAKMYYQIARTYEHLKLHWPRRLNLALGGIVSCVTNHHSRVITVNVNDHTTSLAGGLPDKWMYPGRRADEF